MMMADNNTATKNPNRILFLAIFIDLLGFGLIIPILPIWTTRDLGYNDVIYGILVASYSFMQFLCAPIWGKLSDRKGRKPIIMVGLTGSVIGFFLLTLAFTLFQNIEMLFIARIVSGMFTAATLPTSQAFISDSTTEANRARNFGIIGAAIGLGFTLGPGISAVLLYVNIAAPAFFAMLLAIVNLFWAIKELPESLTQAVRDQRIKDKQKILSRNDLFRLFKQKRTLPIIMLLYASLTFAFVGMESTIILLGSQRFNMTNTQGGLVLVVAGIVAIITQGGLIRKLSKMFEDQYLVLTGLAILVFGFLGLSTVQTLPEILFWVLPIAFGSSIGTPTLISLLSKHAPKEQSGEILGLNSGSGSFMRIIGPLIATSLLNINTSFPYYFSALILVFCIAIGMYLLNILKTYQNVNPLVDCRNCGHALVIGDSFCQYCGSLINSNA